MKLYKYKSLKNFDHVLDIILNQRLHCSLYKDLNDPFEGRFWTVGPSKFSQRDTSGIKIRTASTVEELMLDSDNKFICSLSKSNSDVRLWSFYADNHRGITIEIDFKGLRPRPLKIEYLSNLQELGTSSLGDTSVNKVLSTKTDHWAYEQEYRIIHNNNCFPIPGRITSIYLGPRISDEHVQLLKKCIYKTCPSDFPVFITRLNSKLVFVETVNRLKIT